MQKRVLEVLHQGDPGKVDAGWEDIRRGWVFGSEGFRHEMQSAVEDVMHGKHRDSYSGETAAKHDEQEAGRFHKDNPLHCHPSKPHPAIAHCPRIRLENAYSLEHQLLTK